MFSVILSFFTGKIGPWLLVVGAGVAIFFLIRSNSEKDTQIAQKSDDLKNANFQVTTSNEKNGQLVSSITSLQLNQDELKGFNSQLSQQVAAMGVQMSQLQSLTSIIAHQKVSFDTTLTVRDTSKSANANPLDTGKYNFQAGIYDATFKNQWVTFTSKINLQRGAAPYLSGTNFDMLTNLLIAHETKRKRVWLFFHKVIGVTTHITSPSPYFKLDTLQDYVIGK